MNLKNVNHSNRFDVSGLLALDINRNMILISNEHVSKYFTMIVHSLDKFMKAFYKTRIYKDFRWSWAGTILVTSADKVQSIVNFKSPQVY